MKLPAGWALQELRGLAESMSDGPFGSNLKSSHYRERGPRVIRLANIGQGTFREEDEAHISEEHFRKLERYSVLEGDLVVASLGSDLPRACVVPAHVLPAIVKADCIRVRLRPHVDPRFVCYALLRPDLKHRVQESIHGVGRPRLGMRGIGDLLVPVAPLPEQRLIVELIEEQFSRLAAGKNSLERAKRNGKRLRASVLRGAVHGRLVRSTKGDSGSTFPGHWNQIELATLAKVGSGATPKRGDPRYWSGGTIPWVTSGQLTAPRVSEPADYITQAALEETSVKLWPPGTLLVAMYGEGRTRGNCSELTFPSTTNQACAAIVVHQEAAVLQPFLKLYLTAAYAANRRLASGGVQPNLSLAQLKSLRVPVPPRDEQLDILREVEHQSSVLDELDRILDVELARGRALDRGILIEAFAGRLVPQDSTNDPATKLLDRVRAEKATA